MDRIIAICPGIIDTAMMQRFSGGTPEGREAVIAQEPIGRMGTPEEIAAAVLWLCSDAASFVLGHGPGHRRWANDIADLRACLADMTELFQKASRLTGCFRPPAARTGAYGLAAKLQVSRPTGGGATGPSQGGSAGSNPVGATTEHQRVSVGARSVRRGRAMCARSVPASF